MCVIDQDSVTYTRWNSSFSTTWNITTWYTLDMSFTVSSLQHWNDPLLTCHSLYLHYNNGMIHSWHVIHCIFITTLEWSTLDMSFTVSSLQHWYDPLLTCHSRFFHDNKYLFFCYNTDISFILQTSLSFAAVTRWRSRTIKIIANNSINNPWPASPNMTENRNGNVMIENAAGNRNTSSNEY